mgnify:FL=1
MDSTAQHKTGKFQTGVRQEADRQKHLVTMIQVIKDIIWGWQCKRAIKKANRLSELLGMKYYVIYMNGSLKVVPKRTIRELVAKRRFRKGVKVADIERRAIYVTH